MNQLQVFNLLSKALRHGPLDFYEGEHNTRADRSQRVRRVYVPDHVSLTACLRLLCALIMHGLTGVLGVLAILPLVCPQQLPLNSSEGHSKHHVQVHAHEVDAKHILTREFRQFVQDVANNGTIPGLTLGVVHSGDEVEYGSWGRRTEDDDEMTVDVSVRTSLVITSTLTRHHTFALPFIRHCSRSHHAPKRSSRPPSGS